LTHSFMNSILQLSARLPPKAQIVANTNICWVAAKVNSSVIADSSKSSSASIYSLHFSA
jgi:hypothetical protein